MRDFRADLKLIVDTFKRPVCKIRKDASLLSAIAEYCIGLPVENSLDLNEKAYWFLNRLDTYPICQYSSCQNKTAFRGLKRGYATTCCSKHAAIVSRPKVVQTNIVRYGSPTPLQNVEIRARINKRNLEKYGSCNVVESEYFKEKRIRTCQKNFGVNFPMQNSEVQAKSKATCQAKYGTDYAIQNADVWQRSINACRKLLGVDFPMQSEAIKKKSKDTFLDRYGVEAPAQCPEIRRKQQTRYEYLGRQFDSFPELAYFIWLNDNETNFEYQPQISFKYEFADKQHVYMPDFKVGDQFIEIKGDHFFRPDGTMCNPYDSSQDGLYEAKHQCMLKNNAKIIKTSEMAEIIRYAKKKLGSAFKTVRCQHAG